MKRVVFLCVSVAFLLSSCIVLPKSKTEVYRADKYGFDARSVMSIRMGEVEVDRRVLSREIGADVAMLIAVLVPGNGLPYSASPDLSSWLLNVRIVEREMIRDFVSQYSVMVSIELVSPDEPGKPAITVVHTSESKESISSPYVLKAKLNACLEKLAKELKASSGKTG
jgi:hypothetical protein